MKVLHINAGLENGGGLSHIINLLTEAKLSGQDFELLTLAEGPVDKAAREAGITTYCLGAQSRYDLASLKKLTAFINEHHYDLVHTHGARANLFLSLIHHKLQAKWCITVHSDPYLDFAGRGFLGKIFTKLNLRALKKADCVFAVTQRFAKLITDQVGVKPERVHVIYNGIFFHDDSEIPAKYEHMYFNIVNVARTEKIKGQELLLKALKKIDDSHIRLYIAGDGSQLEPLKALARQFDLSPQVTFHGFMTQKQLKNLYRRMNLAVLTSYSESFPLVLLEASDNQIPILSTDVGDIHMMIPDDQHGFIAKTGDVDSIASQLKKAIAMPTAELEAMGVREKKYVASHFSIKNQLTEILKVYRNLLK
ncbi:MULTISPECIES: glycosyltransferase [Lactobacillus]|uniref:Glycosyltransferase family 1 protein n=1 Tax=Lactobacillus xujianguonis TaxID=2495899 RepID=A0A437SUB3_9LACO|nr:MULTISPECIES: glycosyltransferase [Lactobacillus]RVU70528.1 glycosyltransferase family 1 protein [Lactobacillus xujianguonis]RVU77025.1 glycosyltransferase family 1 protein [Lactobacillus xujianguonis]